MTHRDFWLDYCQDEFNDLLIHLQEGGFADEAWALRHQQVGWLMALVQERTLVLKQTEKDIS